MALNSPYQLLTDTPQCWNFGSMKVFYPILDLRFRTLHVRNGLFSEHFIKSLPIYSPCCLIIPYVAQIVPEIPQSIIFLSDISLNFTNNFLIIIEMVVLMGVLFDHFDKKSWNIFALFALLLLLKDKLGIFKWLLDRVIFFWLVGVGGMRIGGLSERILTLRKLWGMFGGWETVYSRVFVKIERWYPFRIRTRRTVSVAKVCPLKKFL